jgi:L-ascorbate metabolism protein UlaG (beta-lactamase superfamily)
MKSLMLTMLLLTILPVFQVRAGSVFETDAVPTSEGELAITFLGHGSLIFTFDGKVIHVDPFSKVADYSTLPDADLVLITHEHGDHLDQSALDGISTGDTTVIANAAAAGKIPGALTMANGDVQTHLGLPIEAVPAYNVVHERGPGVPFHPRGNGNGYVITFGDRKVYVAGDTENIPEMKNLKGVDIAFIPMNLPYTMTPEMAADAARMLRPAILYPYHFGDTDTGRLTELLKGEKGIELRIRKMP